MAWFKIDDTLHSHPKVRRAGAAAIGLWTASGAYSSAYKLDGFVPLDYVTTWPGGRKLAAALVTAGLWEAAESGWRFHDWSDYQPSAEEIEAERAATRDRQRAFRQRRREAKVQGVTDA